MNMILVAVIVGVLGLSSTLYTYWYIKVIKD